MSRQGVNLFFDNHMIHILRDRERYQQIIVEARSMLIISIDTRATISK